jgi:hypothetical protein
MIGVERPVERHLHGVLKLCGNRLIKVRGVSVRGRGQHHHDPVELRLQLKSPDGAVEDVPQACCLGVAERMVFLELLLERALPFHERGGEQVLFRREIPVERAERDAGVARDLGDLDLVVVAVGKGAQRGADDALPARELVTAQRLGRGRSGNLQHALSPGIP